MTSVPVADGRNHNGSVDDLLEKYKRVVRKHSLLHRVSNELRRALASGMPPRIVLLLGPTGIGKTTLLRAGVRASELLGGPVVYTSCVSVAGSRGYDFGRAHWRQLAQELGVSLADHHQSPDAVAERLRSFSVGRDQTRVLEEYRLGVLDVLRGSGVRAVILDEAQHMTRTPSARSQADQLDVIKHCVDRTGISHVLVGTYELSVLVAPGDQLGRRSVVVHFPPYDPLVESDRVAFEEVFGHLVGALPFPAPAESWAPLREHLRDVFIGCAGCVGVLKDWLHRALQQALEDGLSHIDWRLMAGTRLPNPTLWRISKEIRDYRDRAEPSCADIEALLMGRPSEPVGTQKPKSPARSRPGKRRPVRDPVGLVPPDTSA